MKKICTKCRIEKDICDFNSDNRPHAKFGKRPECRDCGKKIRDKYLEIPYVKEKKKKYFSEYFKKNSDKVRSRRNRWFKQKTEKDLIFRLSRNLRKRIYNFVKERSKKTEEIIGVDFENFKIYMESLFLDNMSWENYGDWQIDHIIPLSSAKSEEDILKLCHHSNLQPLWKIDNIKKGNKLIW